LPVSFTLSLSESFFSVFLEVNLLKSLYFFFCKLILPSKTIFTAQVKVRLGQYHYILTLFNTVAFLFSDEEVLPCPRRTLEDVEVSHIMEGEEAGLPIYAALGARPKRPLPPLPVPPPKPAQLRVVAEVHPSSRSSDSSTYFEVEEEAEEVV
jgi:hypothetical protein